jgi:hypothetical protein
LAMPLVFFRVTWGIFQSYLGKKGDNRATREDIGAITREIESARRAFTHELEGVKHALETARESARMHHDLSKIAAEKRLEIHQEAFARAVDIYHRAHDPEADFHEQVVWWRKNCLYLSSASSAAFGRSCAAAFSHATMVRSPNVSEDVLEKNWAPIRDAPEIIAQAVKLPGIGEAAAHERSAAGA